MQKVFSIGRVVVSLGWARSGAWATTRNEEQRIYLVSLHLLRKPVDDNRTTLLSLIVGPASLIIGFSRAKPLCAPTS